MADYNQSRRCQVQRYRLLLGIEEAEREYSFPGASFTNAADCLAELKWFAVTGSGTEQERFLGDASDKSKQCAIIALNVV
jgi:hypothetical protein